MTLSVNYHWKCTVLPWCRLGSNESGLASRSMDTGPHVGHRVAALTPHPPSEHGKEELE